MNAGFFTELERRNLKRRRVGIRAERTAPNELLR